MMDHFRSRYSLAVWVNVNLKPGDSTVRLWPNTVEKPLEMSKCRIAFINVILSPDDRFKLCSSIGNSVSHRVVSLFPISQRPQLPQEVCLHFSPRRDTLSLKRV